MKLILTATIEIEEPMLFLPGGGTREQRLDHMYGIAGRLERAMTAAFEIANECRAGEPVFERKMEED